jgi:hypothetical protein
MRELKISERMNKAALKVEPCMLITEVFLLVATHLLNAYSVGWTQRIYVALQYIFAQENSFFQSVDACEQLIWIGQHDGADSFALRLVCQKVAIVLHNAILEGHVATALLWDALKGELINTSITVIDVARAMSAEEDNSAVLARAYALRERLRKRMDRKTDVHTHHSSFM